jgi:hypothetical protein
MILELLRALLLAGLPVGVASFFLFTWALRRRAPGAVTSLRAVARDLKRESKERAKLKKERRGVSAVLAEGAHLSRDAQLDLIQNKWLKFGGGFYGVVGLLTYAVVELGDLWNFAIQFESIWVLIARFGPDTLINLLVDALRNFVVAIAWPGYWLSSIDSQYVWLWFVAAYAGYWAGARLALRRFAAAAAVARQTGHPL